MMSSPNTVHRLVSDIWDLFVAFFHFSNHRLTEQIVFRPVRTPIPLAPTLHCYYPIHVLPSPLGPVTALCCPLGPVATLCHPFGTVVTFRHPLGPVTLLALL